MTIDNMPDPGNVKCCLHHGIPNVSQETLIHYHVLDQDVSEPVCPHASIKEFVVFVVL